MTKHYRSSVSALVAGTLVAAAAAGCGGTKASLNSTKVEQGIATSILHEHHVYAVVACPHDVPQKAGHTFSCTAELTAGRYPLTVTEGAKGNVTWAGKGAFVVLDVKRVETAIVDSIKHQRGLKATAACPASVLQQAKVTFTCTARTGGKTYPFTVTETDGDGHVSFVGT